MCGIAGVKFGGHGTHEHHVRTILSLLKDSKLRGQDGFGIVSVKTGKVYKSKDFPTEESEFFNMDFRGDLIIMNARAQPMTEKSSVDVDTLQPSIKYGYVLAHNGVVSNDKEIEETYKLKLNLDTDAVLELLSMEMRNVEKHTLLLDAVCLGQKVFPKLSGGFACALARIGNPNELVLVKDFKTLWTATSKEDFYFASEKETLVHLVGETNIFSDCRMDNVEPYTINFMDLNAKYTYKQPLETKQINNLPPKNDNLVLVCASGGIDSTTSAYVAKKLEGKDVVMVYFDQGQKSREREWECVQQLAKDLGAQTRYIDIRWLGELGASVLTDPNLEIPKSEKQNIKSTVCWTPARNLVMVSILVALAESMGAGAIYNGWTLEEEGSYPDNSIEFFRAFNELLQYGTLTRPEIKLTLGRLMKTEIIQLGQHLGVDYAKTWSCDDGKDSHCGECGACFLHHFAFLQAGIDDPTSYVNLDPKFIPEWVKNGQTKPGNIDDIIRRVK